MVDIQFVERFLKTLFLIILFCCFVNAENQTLPEGTPYKVGLTQVVANITATLKFIAPYISISLIIIGGIVYGLAQLQSAEVRGKWQTIAIGLVVGGVIVGALTAAATAIQGGSGTLLTE